MFRKKPNIDLTSKKNSEKIILQMLNLTNDISITTVIPVSFTLFFWLILGFFNFKIIDFTSFH